MHPKRDFTLVDFMRQMQQVTKLGPLRNLMGMIAGMRELTEQIGAPAGEIERQMDRMRAIYQSMTAMERNKPDLLDGPRRLRIARGAGVQVTDVGNFIKQFEMSRDMMRAAGGMGIMGKLTLINSGRFSDVLGLVTNDSAHHDPSAIQRPPHRWIVAFIMIALLLISMSIAYHPR